MALVVQKFGGSSVANVDCIKNVASIIASEIDHGNKVVVIVSAMGKTTDSLVTLAKEIHTQPSEREMDMLMSTGEQISISLLAMALHAKGIGAISLTGAQVGIQTDSSHMRARITAINCDRITKALDVGNVVIVAGFQGVDTENNITTLGRGGSDTTAVAIAAAINANVCDIYTDVDGIYTADPRIVKNARKLDTITYEEMLELAALGAKVMHARSIEFAKKYGVVVQVRSSFDRSLVGTLIKGEGNGMEDPVISGVTSNKNEAKISILGVPDKEGIASRIFSSLAKENINIDVIIQNVSDHGLTDISYTVPKDQFLAAKIKTQEIVEEIHAKGMTSKENIAKVSIVGVGMKSHSGVAAKMFDALSKSAINIQMITTSEIKVSVVIDESQADAAVKALHDVFFPQSVEV